MVSNLAMFYVEMLKIIYTLFFQTDYYTHHWSRNKHNWYHLLVHRLLNRQTMSQKTNNQPRGRVGILVLFPVSFFCFYLILVSKQYWLYGISFYVVFLHFLSYGTNEEWEWTLSREFDRIHSESVWSYLGFSSRGDF